MKKVLVITYYWPPSGGSGVQRWLKFSKYLREFGWEPVIYTADGGEMPVIDHSLEKDIPAGVEVIKKEIWEPYSVYKKLSGKKKSEKIDTGFINADGKPRRAEKFARWVRGNFFIPDARKFWIKPSTKFLVSYLKDHPVDAIVSTGPPHSMHIIARNVKRKTGIPWIADFRDPWTNIDFYEELLLTSGSDKKHRTMERSVIQEADLTITIGKTMKEEFEALGARKVDVITNGFDQDDVQIGDVKLDERFSIAHVGTLTPSRNHEALWEVLAEMANDDERFRKDLELKFVGKVDFSAMSCIEKLGLKDNVNAIPYLPHQEVITFQQESQVLLLLLNDTPNAKGILTGKFFEYMSAKRPILAIGHPQGDAAEILVESNCGRLAEFKDKVTMRKHIATFYASYKNSNLAVDSSGIENYSRRNLTAELAKKLDQLTG